MIKSNLTNGSLNEKRIPTLNNIDTLVLYICIIDILFLPYIRIISASISMILLPLWYLFNFKKIKIGTEFKLFITAFFLIVVSFSYSLVKLPSWILMGNVTNMVILVYAFLYFFFFKYYVERFSFNIGRFLIAYLSFVLILALIYILDASLYFQIRSFWTMGGNEITVQSSLMIHRFTSTYSDPNNAAVAIVAIMTFLLFNKKYSLNKNLYIILATIIIIISTMSSTGTILLGIILVIYTLTNISSIAKVRGGKIRVSTLYSILFFIFTLPIIFYFLSIFMSTDVAGYSIERYSMNSTDSRLGIWQRLLENENIFSYIFYGMGGTIFVNGMSFSPHNGHFHLIYNYGMIVYVIFMYIFFRKRNNTPLQYGLFLFPLLIGFTMNVGIYEPRFANLMALLVGVYASRKIPEQNRLLYNIEK